MERSSLRSCFGGAVNCWLVPALFAVASLPAAPAQTRDSTSAPNRSPALQAIDTPQEEITLLEPGKSIYRELAGAQTHTFRIVLGQDQYASVIVEQLGVDVVVQVSDSNSQLVAEFDSESRKEGKEFVGLVAESPTDYRLSIKARYPRDAAGRYELRTSEMRPASDHDRAVYQAHKLGTEALKLTEAGKYDEAIRITQRAMELGEGALGFNDPYVGYLAMRMGFLQRTKGDYAQAEPMLRRAIDINEKALGKDHPQTALSLDYLGLVYSSKGDFAKAEEYIQQALSINERTLGPEHPAVANCLMQISLFRQKRGDFETALQQLQRAKAIADKTLQPDDFLAIALIGNLGNLYLDQDNYDRAEPLTERALQLVEKKYGPDNPRLVVPLRNLGSIARGKKQYTRALEFFGRAEALQEKALGSRHPDTASLLLNIGNVYKEQGDYAKALELYQRALGILETAAGPYHELTLMSLANIANTYSAQGDETRAVEYQLRVDQVAEKQIELNLATGSERQKLAFSDWMSERTDRTISLHVQRFPTDHEACKLAALAVLRRKGRVLDAMSGSLTALRQHIQPEDQKLIDELASSATELARIALNGPGKTAAAEYEKQLRSLEERREQLEAEISRSSAGYYERTGATTLAAIEAAIPADGALIELAVYRPFNPTIPDDGFAPYGEPRYVAYVLRHEGEIQWKDLGPVANMDAAVGALRQALRDPQRTDVRRLARVADEHVMQPFRALINNAARLLISADGALNLLPFEALVDEQGRYMAERYSISYLTSGRDLLRMQVARTSKSEPLVLANPLFGEPVTRLAKVNAGNIPPVVTATRRRRSVTTGQDLEGVYFAPLDGTAQEARSIQALFPEAHVLTGTKATKSALQGVAAPQILHIATHGFFLQDAGIVPSRTNGTRAVSAGIKVQNPLLRSGLALSGANLNKGENPSGILTALEASNLNLWGTKLVTLSACDTGVGEVRNGEGVFGLRRSFFLAGAETLVMSLWPVSDYVTREMMTSYYSGLKRGLGRGEALRQAQLAMLRHKGREHPFYWASFIQSGEWANLDGQR